MNYQKELDRILETLSRRQKRASLLLHSCCGPCSSYVLEYLWDKFALTVLFYNPNIHPQQEYEWRKAEQLRLIESYRALGRPIDFLDCDHHPEAFAAGSVGLESQPEGGLRCRVCFAFRLEETARRAAQGSFDFFGTTLTVSPHKNAALINEIGLALAEKTHVAFLPSDFKKRDGYRRSIALSREYDLYRQDYCGCTFSLAARQGEQTAP